MVDGIIERRDEETGEREYVVEATGEVVYRVPASQYRQLRDRLDGLAKQAAKLDCEPVTYREVGREVVIEREPVIGEAFDGARVIASNREVARTYHYLTVSGGYPHLSGWHFVGVIEPTAAGNILKACPGETVPEQYRAASNHCDHCGTDRYRLATFVIRHDDGRTAQVGRNCLAAYLGSNATPERLAKMAEFAWIVRDIDTQAGVGGGRGEQYVDSLEFLSHVAAVARQFGFVTSTQSRDGGGTATGGQVWYILTSSSAYARFVKEDKYEGPSERDASAAQAAIDFARNLEGRNEFELNLKTAASLDAIDRRQVGILAYAIEAHRRSIEREIEREVRERAPKVESKHVGQVGERTVFSGLKVARIHEFETDFGIMRLIRFLDESGNTLIWKTGTYVDWIERAYEAEEPVTVKATVKAHDAYRDTPQTVITRLVAA